MDGIKRDPTNASPPPSGIGRTLTLLIAVSCGVIVANIYYAQPLIALIAPDIGLTTSAAGLIVTLTQLGYGAGLILLAPLGDLMENRRLVLATVTLCLFALILAARVDSVWPFLAASLLIGLGSVVVQMLVPIAARLAPEHNRGRVVGNVMAGLLIGIMMARPLASLIAHLLGWRMVFVLSAVLMAGVLLALARLLPRFQPRASSGYVGLLRSLWPLFRNTPVLRRRAAYQSCQFAAFTLFWTAVPLELAGPDFGLSQLGIGLFALAGVSGALAAPVAGRFADRGYSQAATGVALAALALAFLLARLGAAGGLTVLVAAAILLDLGVQTSMVVGQRAIYGLGGETRNRLNALFLATFFLGGAAGSALAGLAFAQYGWWGVTMLGLVFPAAGLLLFATEFMKCRDRQDGKTVPPP